MCGPHVAPADHPPQLLDDYVARARSRVTGTLADTALRTRSLAARHILARDATGGNLEELLVAARAGRFREVTPREPRPLTDLARVLALQAVRPTDRADGLALFELALARFGPRRIPTDHKGLHAQLALDLGDRRRAAELCELYSGMSPRVARALALDLANPFDAAGAGRAGAGPDPADWLAGLGSYFPEPAPVLRDDPTAVPFDRVTTVEAVPVAGNARVTVIVTCYRPDTRLVTSVTSLLRQSWRNLEVLLIDDHSPAEFGDLLARCAALDPRITLLRLPINRGTYVARNIGLAAATGEFVTFQDSDDWSHPRRIEHQLRPLLIDRALVASCSDGLRVTDQLRVSRPGRVTLYQNTSSLLLRREQVNQRVGFFDRVRKAADTEFLLRVEAVFGGTAVHRLTGVSHALIRVSAGSLSGDELGAGWVHPARAAYRSAYQLWHDQIRAGEADPYLPARPAGRRFARPAGLAVDPVPAPRSYDVVIASEWRPYGGPQRSMIEEIRALTARGLRVGVMQLEAYRFMTRLRKPLCRPIQQLINDGVVEQVLPTDEVETALLVIRYPLVLQFPPSRRSAVRPRRVVILANQGPAERDGTDQRYLPRTCTEVAWRLFGVEPRWCPQGPGVREQLQEHLPASAFLPFDMPGILDLEQWRVTRTRPRSTVPVIGRHSRDNWVKWPADRTTLRQVYPDSAGVDVRILGGARSALAVLGEPRYPPNWLVYDYDEVPVRSFLSQLDFYVYFPHPQWVEAFGRVVLEALAVGCVVIVPEGFPETFGEAVIYRPPGEVRQVVERLHRDPAAYLARSRFGQRLARERFGYQAYVTLIESMTGRTRWGSEP